MPSGVEYGEGGGLGGLERRLDQVLAEMGVRVQV